MEVKMFTIRIYPDGNKWCALLGKDIQNGIVACDSTPHMALAELLAVLNATSWYEVPSNIYEWIEVKEDGKDGKDRDRSEPK